MAVRKTKKSKKLQKQFEFIKKVNILASQTLEHQYLVHDIIESTRETGTTYKVLHKAIKEAKMLTLVNRFDPKLNAYKVPKKERKRLGAFRVPQGKKGEVGVVRVTQVDPKLKSIYTKSKDWVMGGQGTALGSSLFDKAFWTPGTLAHEIRMAYQKDFAETSRYLRYKQAGVSNMKSLVLQHMNFMINVQGKDKYVEKWAHTVDFMQDWESDKEYMVDKLTGRYVESSPELIEKAKEFLGII